MQRLNDDSKFPANCKCSKPYFICGPTAGSIVPNTSIRLLIITRIGIQPDGSRSLFNGTNDPCSVSGAHSRLPVLFRSRICAALRYTTSGALFRKKSDSLVNPLCAKTNYRVTGDAPTNGELFPTKVLTDGHYIWVVIKRDGGKSGKLFETLLCLPPGSIGFL